MKKILCALMLLFGLSVQAQDKPLVLPLWPDGAPTQSGLTGEEKELWPSFITNITVPEITVYKAAKPNGICIICCPGGGYFGVSINNEGHDYAQWMNKLGITMVLLKYRMPNGHAEIPLNDSEQAIRMVRAHASEWGVNPHKVGIMGHSAGGHFAATLSTLYTSAETRPDFSVLVYPVISMDAAITHMGSRENLLGKQPSAEQVEHYSLEKQVNTQTPPAFLVLAADDETVNPENSLRYYSALLKNGIKNCVLHTYPTGGHGYGFGDSFLYKRQWTGELENWIEQTLK